MMHDEKNVLLFSSSSSSSSCFLPLLGGGAWWRAAASASIGRGQAALPRRRLAQHAAQARRHPSLQRWIHWNTDEEQVEDDDDEDDDDDDDEGRETVMVNFTNE